MALSRTTGEPTEGKELRSRAEAAARRSLAIDRNNALGEMALSVALPFIGHYLEREGHQNRALSFDPLCYDALIYTAVTLQFVGRNKEAVRLYKRLPDVPLTPADHTNFVRALWSAGLIEEADQQIARAVSLYPTQATLWFTKLQVLLYSGRHRTAIAMASDLQNAPSGIDERQARDMLAMALALESGDKSKIDQLTVQKLALASKAAILAEIAIRDFCMLGRIDEAFAVADALLFQPGLSGFGFGGDRRRDARTTPNPLPVRTRHRSHARQSTLRLLDRGDRSGRLLAHIGQQAGFPAGLKLETPDFAIRTAWL